MRERPPPQIERGKAIDTEFVIPIYGLYFRFNLGHSWEREDERVQVCKVCDAEWWNDDPPAPVDRNPEGGNEVPSRSDESAVTAKPAGAQGGDA